MTTRIRGTCAHRPLGDDQRGAILVLGIMLGAFLAGALFYLVGVGHAVIWRENVQDAADATAYEAAVWQARGMNVVVAINIFMAIVMGVLIAWRLALLLVALVVAVSAIGCAASTFLPVLAGACEVAPSAGRVLGRMVARDSKVQTRIYKMLRVLHRGQAVVSAAGPILSVARSSFENSQRPNVKFAVALGPLLLPVSVLDQLAGSEVGGKTQGLVKSTSGGRQPQRRGGHDGNGNSKKPNGPQTCAVDRGPGKAPKANRFRKASLLMGKPFSLMVEESSDIDTFCGKANRKMGDVFSLIAKEASDMDEAGDVGSSDTFGGLFSSLTADTGIFCGESDPNLVDNLVSSQVGDACDNAGVVKMYTGKKKKGETAEEACQRELSAASEQARAENGDRRGGRKWKSSASGDRDLAWADVWGPMANGNMFGQTWSLVRAERDHSQIDAAIEVAGSFGRSTSPVADNDDGATVFAQSEMFFDCDSDWDVCQTTAAFTLNWRARLRRVHSPLEFATTHIEKAVSQKFAQIVDAPPIQKVVGRVPLAQFFDTQTGSLVLSSLKAPIEALRSEAAAQGSGAAQWVKAQSADRVSIIH